VNELKCLIAIPFRKKKRRSYSRMEFYTAEHPSVKPIPSDFIELFSFSFIG
jgi:hypothetical protein